VGGLCIIVIASMIVLIINQLGICPYEAEGDARVVVDPNDQ